MPVSRFAVFALFCGLVVLEGLLITIISSKSSLFKTTQTAVQQALYVSSSEENTHVLDQQQGEKKLLLFVAVLTHGLRKARRDAIRETWFTECQQKTAAVRCIFFTDNAGLQNETKMALLKESQEHKDMTFLSLEDNFAFAERLLQTMEWATKRHKLDFFLRIDDDHFLCLDHLLYELTFRPKEALYWGFVHCKPKIVRVDEAWLLLTSDLIEEFLEKRNNSLPCLPYGDQAVAMWINNSSKNVTYFMDNQRIVHKSAGKDQVFFRKDMCLHHLSLHGSYPRAMRQFWLVSQVLRKGNYENVSYDISKITPFSSLCRHSPIFDYKGFIGKYRFEPKPCSQNPKWSISDKPHLGREDTGEFYSKY